MSSENILNKFIKSERLAHAYIFQGAQKSFIEDAALELAKALNCHKKSNGLKSCGMCLSCKKIISYNHPDIEHIRLIESARQIKIEQIRNLQRTAYLKSLEAKKKIYIIYDADSMTVESANCLLKTLEEPPSNVVVILLVANLSCILPTIISRSQVIKFAGEEFTLSPKDKTTYVDEFLNTEDSFSSDSLKFVKRPRIGQIKTVDFLLMYFRDMLVGQAAPKSGVCEWDSPNTLKLMDNLLNAKHLLQSNVNSKLVADYILDDIHNLKATGTR